MLFVFTQEHHLSFMCREVAESVVIVYIQYKEYAVSVKSPADCYMCGGRAQQNTYIHKSLHLKMYEFYTIFCVMRGVFAARKLKKSYALYCLRANTQMFSYNRVVCAMQKFQSSIVAGGTAKKIRGRHYIF